MFIASRLTSLLFTVLSVLLVGYILYKNTRRNIWVSVLGASMIYQVLGLWFLTSSRPDSLLVLCAALVVATAMKAIDEGERGDLWWFIALFFAVSAFFVKQSGAIYSISIGVLFIVERNWKMLGKLVVFGLGIFALYLVVLPIGSLELFLANIVGGVANSISFHWFYDWTLRKLLFEFAPLIALNFVIVGKSLKERKNRKFVFLSVCSISFFLFSMLTALKIGAGVGYFQDYLIVAVILVGMALTDYFRDRNISVLRPIYVACVYLCLVAFHCSLFVYQSYINPALASYVAKYIEQRDVANFIKKTGLGEGEWVYVAGAKDFKGYFLKHFFYKNILTPFDDLVFIGDRNGTFDFTALRELTSEGRIKYVICGSSEEPVTILGQKIPNLTKIYSTNNLEVYRSNGELSAVSVDVMSR